MIRIKVRNLQNIIILLYFISISTYQLGTGFDAMFVRFTFIALVVSTVLIIKKIKITEHLQWCISFWGLYFISMFWASNINDTLYYINNAIQIIGISVCIPLIVKNKKDIDLIINLYILSLIYTIIVLIIRTPTSAWGTERLGMIIGLSPNTLGIRLSIGAVMCLYLLHQIIIEKKKLYKIATLLYCGVIVSFFTVILFTGSKKGLFAFLFCMFSYELIITKGLKIFFKVIAVTIAICIIGYIIFTNDNLYSVLGRRIERFILTIQGTATGYDIDTSFSERQFFIERAKELFFNNMILGYGGNNFKSYMREISYSHIAYSHNNFFELLSTLGIIGFVLYYYIWVKSEIKMIKKYVKHNNKQCLLFAIIIFSELIMDYAVVSYTSEFTHITLILAMLSIQFDDFKQENTIYIKK